MDPAASSTIVKVADNDVDTMASFPLFESVPRAELEWLAARGHVERFAAGSVISESGSPIDDMWIVLAGRVAAHAPNAGSLRKYQDVGPGYIGGTMPFSRLRAGPLRVVAEDDTTLFALNRSDFTDLVRECPELTAALVHQLIDRSRDYRTAQIHDERLRSLGRLAAGLAHELNNPASGAASHARSLPPLLDDLHAGSTALARARLTDGQLEAVDAVRRMCNDSCSPRSPLESADREEEFSEWLLAHDIDPTAAAALASATVSLTALERLASVLPGETLGVAIGWAASDAAARQATAHITAATDRIHALVSAIKGFTFMDREGVREDGQRDGEHDGGADALHRAGDVEEHDVVRRRARGRCRGEHDEADGEQAPAPEAVGERPGGEDHGGERERVGVDHPLQAGQAGAQVLGNP